MMEILFIALIVAAVVSALLPRTQPRQPEPVRIPVEKTPRHRR